MRAFAHNQKLPRRRASSSLARSNTATSAPLHRARPVLTPQSRIGSQPPSRLPQVEAAEPEAGRTPVGPTSFAHDFSRILFNRTGGDQRLLAAFNGREAGSPGVEQTIGGPAWQRSAAAITSIPAVSADERIIEEPSLRLETVPVEAPANGAGGGATPTGGGGAAASSCDVPMSMTKITSGAFAGGLAMGDYYPDLVGRGFWMNGATGGAWDTGSRAGVNVQLFGTVPSPCLPGQYTLEQSVTRDWEKINGVETSRSGTTSDDIAASGRDQSRAPFRQLFLGNGLNISMADPPSAAYSSTLDVDYKKRFVTSLRGPGGRQSVNWTIELKTSGGSVVTNSVS